MPKLADSSIGLSICSTSGFDVKQAAEIGALLLLGKPLVLVLTPGAEIPEGLRRAADRVIEEWDPDNTEAQEQLAAAIRELGGG